MLLIFNGIGGLFTHLVIDTLKFHSCQYFSPHFSALQNFSVIDIAQTLTFYKESLMEVYYTLVFKHVMVSKDVKSKQKRVLKRAENRMPFKLFAFHFLEHFDANFTAVTLLSWPTLN